MNEKLGSILRVEIITLNCFESFEQWGENFYSKRLRKKNIRKVLYLKVNKKNLRLPIVSQRFVCLEIHFSISGP